MTKRISEDWLLALGDLRDVNAIILADVEGYKPKIISVMVTFKAAGAAQFTWDAFPYLTHETREEMTRYLTKLHCIQDAVIEWDIPDGAA